MSVAIQDYEGFYVPRGSDITRKQASALRTLRTRSGLTQEQVAASIPMKIDTYRGYEKGYTELRLSQLPQFASALQVSVAALMQETGLMTLNARDIRVADVADLADSLDDLPASDAAFIISNARQQVEHARQRDRELNN